MAKITKATVKSFIRKNEKNLFVSYESRFDGMTDMVEQNSDKSFQKVTFNYKAEDNHRFGVPGIWFVGGSRDYLTEVNKDGFKGIAVYNCCGSFVVAVKG